MHTEAHMISDETEAEGIVHLAQETGSKTYQWFTLACGDAYLFFQCVVMVYWLTCAISHVSVRLGYPPFDPFPAAEDITAWTPSAVYTCIHYVGLALKLVVEIVITRYNQVAPMLNRILRVIYTVGSGFVHLAVIELGVIFKQLMTIITSDSSSDLRVRFAWDSMFEELVTNLEKSTMCMVQ
jgi:hypothetical protein